MPVSAEVIPRSTPLHNILGLLPQDHHKTARNLSAKMCGMAARQQQFCGMHHSPGLSSLSTPHNMPRTVPSRTISDKINEYLSRAKEPCGRLHRAAPLGEWAQCGWPQNLSCTPINALTITNTGPPTGTVFFSAAALPRNMHRPRSKILYNPQNIFCMGCLFHVPFNFA
uniref:Uncharacterized protein n=1 Tax=Eutreptiella gymnastica TaxID=73025 RepID=A0A7S4FSL8_9EUGL